MKDIIIKEATESYKFGFSVTYDGDKKEVVFGQYCNHCDSYFENSKRSIYCNICKKRKLSTK